MRLESLRNELHDAVDAIIDRATLEASVDGAREPKSPLDETVDWLSDPAHLSY